MALLYRFGEDDFSIAVTTLSAAACARCIYLSYDKHCTVLFLLAYDQ